MDSPRRPERERICSGSHHHEIPFYLILVLLLVPLQTTLLPHLSVWNIKPDLGLVAAALVGLLAGELEGLLVGLAIGWVLNLFSAGELWLSLLTNGGVGLLAGFLGRQVSQVTSISLGVGCCWCLWRAGWSPR